MTLAVGGTLNTHTHEKVKHILSLKEGSLIQCYELPVSFRRFSSYCTNALGDGGTSAGSRLSNERFIFPSVEIHHT